MDWKSYERAIVQKFRYEFPEPTFRVEPRGQDDFYITGRHSGEWRQVDVAVFRRGADGPFLVVDAKHWSTPVDIPAVEAFIGFVDDVGAQVGVLTASSRFTQASPRRAGGAALPIHLEVVTAEEALRWDWRAVGQSVFPWDWVFHEHLGRALRLIEADADLEEVAEALAEVAFEEWDAAAAYAGLHHPVEAQIFLRWVAWQHEDGGWRFHAARHLAEMGQLDEPTRRAVIRREADPEVRAIIAGI